MDSRARRLREPDRAGDFPWTTTRPPVSSGRSPPARTPEQNAGKAWTREEDERLLASFDGGATVEQLVAQHERTRAGIEARLVKHGRLDLEQAPAARIR
jgi:hypothetical protein